LGSRNGQRGYTLTCYGRRVPGLRTTT
jgi:hypothetical protein